MTFTLNWTIKEKDAGKEIKAFLAEEKVSGRALTDIKFSGGRIQVNGKEENVRYVLHEGDRLDVRFPDEKINDDLKAENIPLEILYEDRDLLILNKPPGISTIPSREHPGGSIANALAYYYGTNGIRASIHIVTRLDRHTSGLVLVAKHRHAHHLFGLMQRESKIYKAYLGIAAGIFNRLSGTIDAPIGRNPKSIIEREVREDGKRAVTKFKVEKQMKEAALVKMELQTGRTHQLRVHMAFIGHPLLGDDLYGGPAGKISRQALHCSELSFFHPLKKRKVDIRAPLSADLAALLEEL